MWLVITLAVVVCLIWWRTILPAVWKLGRILVGIGLFVWAIYDIPFLFAALGPVGATAIIGGSIILWYRRRRKNR